MRRAEEFDPGPYGVFDGAVRVAELLANLARAACDEQRVGHGVIADEMPRAGDGRHYVGALAGECANDEKCGPDAVVSEDFQKAESVGVIGPVVVGEGDFAGVRSGDYCLAEYLRCRPHRGVSVTARGQCPCSNGRCRDFSHHFEKCSG